MGTIHLRMQLSCARAWIIEDDPDATRGIALMLAAFASEVRTFASGAAFVNAWRAAEEHPDLLCLDLSLPDTQGLTLLSNIRQEDSSVPVVIITSDTSDSSIERAVGLGAYEYLFKNTERSKYLTTFSRAIEQRRTARRLEQQEIESLGIARYGMFGNSAALRKLLHEIEQLGPVDVNVLITGESGTGKELIARALHGVSRRKQGPLITINCAALPHDLCESELFGHERGSFTGADSRHFGAFERAHGGTLFLDEIGELDLAIQAKLLRAIQERRFLRVGGRTEIVSEFRLIVATNRDLACEMKLGRFRQDLYYRLATAEIEAPPLRERGRDIRLLAHHFMKQFGATLGRRIGLSEEAAEVLERNRWSGNVRELQNVIQSAMIQCPDEILYPHHLPLRIRNAQLVHVATQNGTDEPQVAKSVITGATGSLQRQEREAILGALRKYRGDIRSVAEELGISRATLYRKLRKHSVSTRGQY